jgi:hypothetical protein
MTGVLNQKRDLSSSFTIRIERFEMPSAQLRRSHDCIRQPTCLQELHSLSPSLHVGLHN